jgi:peptidoglycan lytic transglycosylase
MGRWLVILSLALVHWPDGAAASAKSSQDPPAKRPLSAFTPIPRPAPRQQTQIVDAVTGLAPTHMVEAQDQDVAVRHPATLGPVEPVSPVYEPARPSDCSGGRRITSAFYSQGRRTASGQPFDPHGMTAAHRTLPFGTHLTVTNPRTGKSVMVLVNDRGPFVSGVSLDLSLGAAQAIGLRGTGTVCIW